ncbi:MAG: YebC/PmpR family DNA-binding transcriptional regulator [Proteobacteria bacterium]|nr:YebC/PmpR family DNA-binding transcriptional regulator [Pseudomonadota bacterium]
MAGHSQFKNIMHRKGKQDAIKARQFNKIAREITVAARSGLPDPAHNPRLKAAVQSARAMNMPRERIEKAIKSAAAAAGEGHYDEIRYEGYGPGGIALIVECLTDNRNRTASDVRAAFSKNGGSLGETNSVSFMFRHGGLIHYPAAAGSADAMMEAVIEAGGEDVESFEAGHDILTSVEDFTKVREALEKKLGPAETARLGWKPQNLVPVSFEAAEKLIGLLEILEEHDDVQHVTGNFDIAEEVLKKLAS